MYFLPCERKLSEKEFQQKNIIWFIDFSLINKPATKFYCVLIKMHLALPSCQDTFAPIYQEIPPIFIITFLV